MSVHTVPFQYKVVELAPTAQQLSVLLQETPRKFTDNTAVTRVQVVPFHWMVIQPPELFPTAQQSLAFTQVTPL